VLESLLALPKATPRPRCTVLDHMATVAPLLKGQNFEEDRMTDLDRILIPLALFLMEEIGWLLMVRALVL